MTRRRRRIPASTRGFSLVEILVATVLMAIVMAALATVTAQWLPNWNRGVAAVQRGEALAVGLERLTEELAAAAFVSAGRGRQQPMFDGRELAVTFVRTATGPNARPGLDLVRIAEVGSERGPALVRTRAPFVPTDPDGGPQSGRANPQFADPVALIRAPFRVSFAYAGPDRVWRPTWQEQPRLPDAIRITVRSAATGRTIAASTTATIRTEIPQHCIGASGGGGGVCGGRDLPVGDLDNPARPATSGEGGRNR